MASYGFNAFSLQAEHPPRLSFSGNLEFDLASQSRYFQLTAQGGKRERYGYFAVKIIAIAFKNSMRPHAYFHVKIAGRSATHAGLTFAGQSNSIATIHASRNFNRQGPGFTDPALTTAIGTGVADTLARTLAGRAGLLNREDTLLHPDLTNTTTGAAGFLISIPGATALTGFALPQRRHLDFTGQPCNRVFQVEVQREA